MEAIIVSSSKLVGLPHKVRIYKEYHSEYPLVGNWDSPIPSLASECAPPPRTKGGVGTLACGWGVGESQFRRLEKKLNTLPTLGITTTWWESSMRCTLAISRHLFTANSSVHCRGLKKIRLSFKKPIVLLFWYARVMVFYGQKSVFWLFDVIFKHLPFVYILQTIFILQNYLLYWVFKGKLRRRATIIVLFCHHPPPPPRCRLK